LPALALTSSSFHANEHNGCIAVNNSSNNRITVFEILGATGELKPVQEIPTLGHGSNGGYFSLPQIVSTPTIAGRSCVFAANAATSTVTAFRGTIEHNDPGPPLTLVSPPVALGPDASFGALGGGLALHPDGASLYTANPGSSNISTFLVGSNCGLGLTGQRVGAPTRPSDIQVQPDGHCLAVVSPVTDTVAMYSISPDRSDRTPIPVKTFIVPGPGHATSVEFSRFVTKDTLYVTKAHARQTVIVRFHVQQDCTLEESPVITSAPSGRVSTVAKLDPENQCLFVPNQASATVSLFSANHPPSTLTSFAVHPTTGDLTFVTTVEDVAFLPAGLGFAQTNGGKRSLYYTSFGREVFRRPLVGCSPGAVAGRGVPTGVAGTGLLRALTVLQ
jgi:6-phosphogluconolactonase (cycloisomerase 2 family)